MTGEDYLRRVDLALGDLPWHLRRELVAELRVHLAELPAGSDFEAQLGTPERYAADLRSAAGLERRRGAIVFLRARRPRNVILIVLALTVMGLSIGAVAWIESYQPIAFAGATQWPAGAKSAVGQAGESVAFRQGRPFEFGIDVQNIGRFTVRVLGAPYSPVFPFSAHLLMSAPQKSPGNEKPLSPFHPFDMKPGEFRWLLLRGVYECGSGIAPGQAMTLGAFPVRFSFLWRTTTISVPLRDQLELVVPKGCPSRVAQP